MNSYPKLDVPGAGLPWLELFFLRNFYYPIRVQQSSWEENLKRFERETQNIIQLCQPLTEEQFQTRILIPRLKGMEDSSRFWSIALTIQHLLITIPGMTFIALELAKGSRISVEVDTAKVKPLQENVTTKKEMLQILREAAEKTVSQLKVFSDDASSTFKVRHPWFGPISSEGWVWVIGQHQSLHRKQIQLIAQRL